MRAVKEVKMYTRADVAKHCSENDCWVIYQDKVLDLTKWAAHHPGGPTAITTMAGVDATDEITVMHPEYVTKTLIKKYVVGQLYDTSVPAHVAEYRALIDRVIHDPRWMTTSPSYYLRRTPFYIAILAASVALYGHSSSIIAHFMAGGLLGLFWQQTLLVGHDAGHGAITGNMDKDVWIGLLVGTILNGFSIMWWRFSHNTHHVTTNSVEHDPDIQHLPFVAVSKLFLESVYSSYRKHNLVFGPLAKLCVQWQSTFFLPVMAFARIYVHVEGLKMLLDFSRPVPHRFIELAGFALYFTWVYALVVVFGGACGHSGWSMLAYFLGAHVVAAIIHIQITLNHFASPAHTDKGKLGPRDEQDFLTSQLRGTCDIDIPQSLDWFFGGLQFQVEHHLCPHMPRHNLRAFADEIRSLSLRHGLPYVTRTFASAVACVRVTLADVGELAAAKEL